MDSRITFSNRFKSANDSAMRFSSWLTVLIRVFRPSQPQAAHINLNEVHFRVCKLLLLPTYWAARVQQNLLLLFFSLPGLLSGREGRFLRTP